jgi:hypothetical protein
MSKATIIKWFFGSLIGLAGGLALLVVAGALALANDVFIMRGPDVVGVRSGTLAWTLAGLVGLAILVMIAAAVAMFVAWIGAVLNTANLPSKNWCVALVVIGLLGFVFIAALAYVIGGPDGTEVRALDEGADQGQLRTGEAGSYPSTPRRSG